MVSCVAHYVQILYPTSRVAPVLHSNLEQAVRVVVRRSKYTPVRSKIGIDQTSRLANLLFGAVCAIPGTGGSPVVKS